MNIAGIDISHPEKLIFPEINLTKLDVIEYYNDVADKMLPFLKHRVLTLHRFPDGIAAKGFYQKNASDYFPDFIETITVKTEEGSNCQVVCSTKKSLIYLANQGTLEFHIWLSKKDKLDTPDKVVFDLDPSDNSFEKVKEAAHSMKMFLKERNINSNLMLTGQSGVHVWYTVRRTKTFDEVRNQLKKMAKELEAQYPELFTTEMRTNKRGAKVFIDYLRNSYGQTTICPYSLRANAYGGIATPIGWNSLNAMESAHGFTIKNQKKR